MSHLRGAFEKELRFRLTQKTKTNQAEDAILLKSFRYYDLAGIGMEQRSILSSSHQIRDKWHRQSSISLLTNIS